MIWSKKIIQTHFTVNLNDITVEVWRKPVKNIRIRICPPDGQVKATFPLQSTDRDIEKMLLEKAEWIRQNVITIKNRSKAHNKEYVTGDIIQFLGKKLTLIVVIHNKPPKVELQEDKIILYVRQNYTIEQRKSVLVHWLGYELISLLPALIHKWETILNVKTNGIRVRPMTSRWGSCNIRTHKIHFNVYLIQKPMRCIEYVVAHELTHIIVSGHGPKFYAILDSHFEDAAELKKLIKARD